MSYNAKEHKKAKKLHKIHLSKKWVIICAAIVLIVGGGIGGWFYFYNQRVQLSTKEPTKQELARIESVKKVADGAEEAINNGSTVTDAAAMYDAAIKATDDSNTISMLNMEKSILYYNNNDNDAALAAALASESSIQAEDTEQFIATIYVKKGDNQNAIKYYKRAILSVDSTQPTADYSIQYYQNRIKFLGGESN